MNRNNNSVIFSFALGLFLLVFFSCRKEPKATVSWAFFDFPFNEELTSVKIQSIDNWHIVGGITWESGIYVNIINQQTIRIFDSIAPKRLNFITLDDQANLYTGGYTGQFLVHPNDTLLPWVSNRLIQSFDILRDADFLNDSTGITVAGVAFKNGIIFRQGKHAQTIQMDTFPFSLRAVKMLDKDNAIAVGYGVVLKLSPSGKWKRLPLYGDFFMDVDFPSHNTGYIVGNAGSILKTTDAGATWTFLQKKNTYSKKTAFRAVHFIDNQNGFITGEHGLLWKTTDGGEHWTVGNNLPDIEFQGLDVIPDLGILVGKSGSIVTFDPHF